MGNRLPRLLLIESNPDLCELEEFVLSGAGYEVQALPSGVDPVGFIRQSRPDAVVMSIPPNQPRAWENLDRLTADATTQTIPVVVISTTERTVAEAQTLPVVRYTLVAPYDIEALETAVNTALRHPPPAAAVPRSPRTVARISILVADEIGWHHRAIVLATIRELLEHQPYRSRFPELSRALVDELGLLLGTIANGVRYNLTPEDTFSEPETHRMLAEHVRLRIEQGLGPSSTVREQQLLRSQIEAVLPDLVGRDGVTCQELLGVSGRIREYADYLIRVIVEAYTSGG